MSFRTARDDEERPDRTRLDNPIPGRETVLNAQGRAFRKTTLDGAQAQPTEERPHRSDFQPLPGALSAAYTVREALATRGAEADLYLVERRADGQLFVAKIYRPNIPVKIDLLDRVARADPAHVVTVVAHGLSDGRYYELQEYVALGSLAELLTREGPRLAPDLAQGILRELLMAVRHLHASGITHRDLKPANVLVRSRRPLDLVLTDFGISSLMHDESVRFTTGNRTIAYSAPESDSGMVTQASDYWSLGMMVAEIITGEHPYAGLSDQVLSGAKATRPVPLNEVPEPWLKLCRGLLTRDPQQRWGSDHVGRWLKGDRTLPEPVVEQTQAAAGPQVRPCHFYQKEYGTAEALAAGFAGNWGEGLKYLERNHLHKWLAEDLRNQELAVFLEDLDLDSGLDGHAKLFRAILKMNPALPPTYRGILLTTDNLATLARGAVNLDPQSQVILTSLLAGGILTALNGSPQTRSLCEVGKKWVEAEGRYAALRSATENKCPSQRSDERQTESVRLGLLLLGVLDQEFVAEFRRQTQGIATDKAREAGWYTELGNPGQADPPALLLMQEMLKPAEEAAERQREEARRQREREQKQREEARQQRKMRAKARAEKIQRRISHGVMVIGPLVAGYFLYPHWLHQYTSNRGGFMEAWFILGAPGVAIFAGYLAAELWTVLTFGRSSGGDALGQAFFTCLLAPFSAGIGGLVLYLLLLLLNSLFYLHKDDDTLQGIGVGVAYLVLWIVVGCYRRTGKK